MQLALRFHTSVLSIALVFRNPEMSPDESVFQFQQIQKKEMIYFVLGLSISVSIKENDIYFFFETVNHQALLIVVKKKMEIFFPNRLSKF